MNEQNSQPQESQPQEPQEVIDDSPAVDSGEKEAEQETSESTENTPKEAAQPEEEYLFNLQNVKGEFPIFLKVEKFDPQATTVTLPGSTREYVVSKISDAPNTRLDDSAKSGHWSEVMRSGLDMIPQEGMYQGSLEREGTEWQQAIDNQGKRLMGVAPQLSNVSGEALSGERGALRFLRFAGLGSVFMVPLWHTGIWITLKTPSEARLLELNREMLMDKIQLGRSTYGLALSATVSAYTERLLKVAMEHLYSSNLKTDKHLFDVISSHDIPSIIWGMACVIWNNGFQYERACTHNPEKCNHVVQEKLDVTKLSWVNKNALTPWQVAHMSRKKSGEVTMEDVERYRKEMLSLQNRRIELKTTTNDNSYYFDLHVPTIREYFEHSNDWISSVVSGVEKSLEIEPTDNERIQFVTQNAQSTIMRQYSHWVENITFGDNTINDKETIETILEYTSVDDDVRDKFTAEVKKYINDSVVSVIGIPTYECPKCGGKQKYNGRNDSLYSIIPLDMLQTFFSLLVQKIISIRQR